MKYKGQRILIWSIIPYSNSTNSNIEKSFWVFHPVYQIKKINDIIDFPDPFMFNLKDIEINKNGMSATIIESNESIALIKTVNGVDKKSYENHLIQMLRIPTNLKQMYWEFLEGRIKDAIADFLYNHAWV